jgi:site-specific recombinase XerD
MTPGSAPSSRDSHARANLQRDTVTMPLPPRKLHLGHFAFMRALVQGVDTRTSWNRYLRIEGEHSDAATVRKTVAWLRDEFAAAARRRQRHGAARLVLVDIANVARDAPVLPSLADFVIERGLADFSEAEQLAAYDAEHGNATGGGSRRARLIGRQLEALRWLEGLVAESPHAEDALASWLHPDLAIRLHKAGLTTLASLIDRINGLGSAWYRSLPAIGATKAARVVDWLRAHEATIGKAVGAHTMVPRASLSPASLQAVVPSATAIVPLEKLIVPDALSGADGLYRLPQQQCRINAGNDHQAILAWVHAKQGANAKASAGQGRKQGLGPGIAEASLPVSAVLSHTQRAYLKEAERFFLWAILQRQKPLSSMTLEDCNAYCAFLADPQPAGSWCGPRARARWSPLWRPFEGPLTPVAQRRAIAILKSLYRFLADQCYLQCNPFAGITPPKQNPVRDRRRSLTAAQWAFVRAELAALPSTSANLRLKCALLLLVGTGLRISEAVSARLADLRYRTDRSADGDGTEIWELSVVGKGGKERYVPFSLGLVAELQSYLASRGLPAQLSVVPKEAFLLGRAVDVAQRASWSPAARTPVERLAGIGTATLHDQLKCFFSTCARKMQETNPLAAQHLVKASAHWLRHTHGFHAVAAGMSLRTVQQNLGHASLGTTTRYTAGEGQERAVKNAGLRCPLDPT